MPDLQPIVKSLDEQIRGSIPELRYAVKWKRPFYELPDLGGSSKSPPTTFRERGLFGGADFDLPPPLGDSGRSRYVKVRTLEEAQTVEMTDWIALVARASGWR